MKTMEQLKKGDKVYTFAYSAGSHFFDPDDLLEVRAYDGDIVAGNGKIELKLVREDGRKGMIFYYGNFPNVDFIDVCHADDLEEALQINRAYVLRKCEESIEFHKNHEKSAEAFHKEAVKSYEKYRGLGVTHRIIK